MIVSDDRVTEFVARQVGARIVPPYTVLGVERDGAIVAGAVFNCWTGNDIEATVAALSGGVTRSFLKACAAYVFGQIGCGRVSFTTESRSVVDLARRLGAQSEGRKVNLYGPGRHGFLLGLSREDWKFS